MRLAKSAPQRTLILLCAALLATLCLVGTRADNARAAWDTTVNVTNGNVVLAGKAFTVVDSSGTVTAVWSELRNGNYGVYASRNVSGSWGAPVLLSAATGSDATQAAIVVDSSGVVTVMWNASALSNNVITAARYSGGAWSSPVAVSGNDRNANQANPRLAVDSSGVVTAVWSQYLGATGSTPTVIKASRFSGGAWSTPAQLSSNNCNASSPQVTTSGTGTAAAVWIDCASNFSSYRIATAQFASGAWGSPTTFEPSGGSSISESSVQITVDGAGVITAMWPRYSSTSTMTRMMVARLTAGSWSTPAEVTGDLYGPVNLQLAADALGNVTAIWLQYDSVNSKYLTGAMRYSGSSWSTPTVISPATGSGAISGQDFYSATSLAVGSSGLAVAAWSRSDGTSDRIQVARFEGGSWGSPLEISNAGNNRRNPTLVIDSANTITAVWGRLNACSMFCSYNGINATRYVDTTPAAPNTPNTPTAVAGDAQATITVTNGAGAGGIPTSYRVTAVGVSPAKTCDITVPATSCDITGLTNGTSYTFTATATNGGGTSSDSGPSSAVTPAIPPGTCGTSGTFTITANHIVSNSSCVGTVTVPSTVTDIDASAFSGAAITGVTFTAPSSLTTIGQYAFLNTTSLGSITLPDSVTTIGQSAFNGSHVTSVTLPSNPSFTTIPTGMFANASSLTTITIPTNVTTIGMDAFNAASSLTGVTFTAPSGVTSLGDRAFVDARNLTSITIPNSVTIIGSSTFAGASSLTSITIPSSVTSIGDRVFYNATGLTSVTLPTNPSFTSMGSNTFQNASSLQSITIPDSVTSIGGSTFAGTSSLTGITIPSNVTTIGSYAFQNATGLTSINVPSNVTSIGSGAFQGVSGVAKLSIPSGVTTLGESAFSNMPALTRIEFLGNQPSCSGFMSMPCTNILSGSTNATVYRFASATGWPSFGTTYQTRPQAYLVLPTAAPTAVAGDASATITVAAPASGPTPDTYTVAAASDGSKTCTITAPTTSCTVTGLTNGTSYTFTAVANTTSPAASSVVSAASNAVTPTAAVVPPSNNGSNTTPTSTSPATTTTSSTAAAPTVLRLTSSRPEPTGSAIITTFTAPGPGAVHHVGTVATGRRSTRAATVTVCTYDQTINAAGVVHVTCNLNNAGRRLRTQQALVITLSTTYTPTSGTPMVSTKNVRVARTHIAKAPAQTTTVQSTVTG